MLTAPILLKTMQELPASMLPLAYNNSLRKLFFEKRKFENIKEVRWCNLSQQDA
jgi:hypothetical protein